MIRNCIFRYQSLDISYLWVTSQDSRHVHFAMCIYIYILEESLPAKVGIRPHPPTVPLPAHHVPTTQLPPAPRTGLPTTSVDTILGTSLDTIQSTSLGSAQEPAIPTYEYIYIYICMHTMLFMQNPNQQSELTNFFTLRREFRKTSPRESRFLIVIFLIVCFHRVRVKVLIWEVVLVSLKASMENL